ncbi:hypothetical protein K450DRAFT_248777 [Umbelopsis ramanniana AG]|uniref:Uncharacterized protein n=1 Tax=Umbelopsis ramanniana AG TaxID=1314678 RepID=A0AAD5E9D4_UMBRA|nr:uncharacterized protein K450DRAFT_248777 [Umbelopsis ramanniana AG]KAI8578050.1 hypothetical protein K450DRAFT_248777 [Umbelopsis ramanniana AG]
MNIVKVQQFTNIHHFFFLPLPIVIVGSKRHRTCFYTQIHNISCIKMLKGQKDGYRALES